MNQVQHLLSKFLARLLEVKWVFILKTLLVGFSVSMAISIVLMKTFYPELQKPRKPEDQFNVEEFGASLNQLGFETIIKRNIFNIDGEVADLDDDKKKDKKSSEIHPSTLPLKLLGTIYGGDPFSGLAVIENTEKRATGSFMVGDEVMKRVVLVEVLQEKIILENDGEREFIEIARPHIRQGRRQKAGKKAVTGPAKNPNQVKEEGFERNGNAIVVSNEYKQKLLTTDFSKVLQDAKAEPYFEGAELSGFKLTRIREESFYEKAGLQDGDIVKEINGVSLTDTAQAIRLLNSLRGEAEIELRIVRNGAAQVFTLKVR